MWNDEMTVDSGKKGELIIYVTNLCILNLKASPAFKNRHPASLKKSCNIDTCLFHRKYHQNPFLNNRNKRFRHQRCSQSGCCFQTLRLKCRIFLHIEKIRHCPDQKQMIDHRTKGFLLTFLTADHCICRTRVVMTYDLPVLFNRLVDGKNYKDRIKSKNSTTGMLSRQITVTYGYS